MGTKTGNRPPQVGFYFKTDRLLHDQITTLCEEKGYTLRAWVIDALRTKLRQVAADGS